MSDFITFIKSRIFFKHLTIISLVFITLVAVISIALSFYTSHGEKRLMPDLRGKTMEEAREMSSDFDFEFKIVDSIYIPELKRGTVIDHTPKPGFNIKKSRVVFLTMNSFNPEYIKMPDLVNTSLRQAKSTMESCGLQLGRLHYKPDLAENYVLMQYYKGKRLSAGAKIPKGSKIDLIVGLGSGEGLQTSIPNVTGMTYNEAVSAISSAKLNVGAKVFAPEILTFADSVDAQVWKQDPLPEEKLQPGSLVDIWLKKKTESESNTNNELNEFENE